MAHPLQLPPPLSVEVLRYQVARDYGHKATTPPPPKLCHIIGLDECYKFGSLALGTRGVPILVRGPSKTRQEPIPSGLIVLRSFSFLITLRDLEHTGPLCGHKRGSKQSYS